MTNFKNKVNSILYENSPTLNSFLATTFGILFNRSSKESNDRSDEDKKKVEKIVSTVKKNVGPSPSQEDIMALKLKLALLKYKPNIEHLKIMTKEAEKQNVSPHLVAALVAQESSFREKVSRRNRNGSTDYGYFQLNSDWHEQYKSNTEQHIKYGIKFLKWCLKTEGYNEKNALARYNAGSPKNQIGQRYASMVLDKKREILDDIEKNERIMRRLERAERIMNNLDNK